jgi:hypothetical protein
VCSPALEIRTLKRFLPLLCTLFLGLPSFAATPFFPLKDVKPGLKGVGKTVFQGGRVVEFQVDLLGIIENTSPKQSIVLARLSGGPLAETGVIQGMSGSPVYIDGKLLGAVALGFPFSKEPIAGIQPIEQMIQNTPPRAPAQSVFRMNYRQFASEMRAQFQPALAASLAPASQPELRDISTPLAFSGFTEATVRAFGSKLRALGFEPQIGIGGGAPTTKQYAGTVQPGDMISVQLMNGDLNVGADGTVTYVDGKKIYAFGHRFLDAGVTDLPFARAEVLALLPSLNASFKISAPRELVGSITSDVSTAVAGEIGRSAHLVPVHVLVKGATGPHDYHINVASDRLLTPVLTQMALFSAIDATERSTGAGSLRVDGHIEFEGNEPSLDVSNVFTADSAVALQAAISLVTPLSFAMQSGFHDLQPKRISFIIEPSEQKRQLQIDEVWLSQREAHPGDTIDITCALSGEHGQQFQKAVRYRIPIGAPLGRLFFTVSDGNLLNFSELAGLTPQSARSGGQLVGILNGIRPNDRAYVRIWRQEPSFQLPGADLTDPPPSAALVLSKSSSSVGGGNTLVARGAQVAEMSISAGNYVISGSKTVQLEIKE